MDVKVSALILDIHTDIQGDSYCEEGLLCAPVQIAAENNRWCRTGRFPRYQLYYKFGKSEIVTDR